MTAGARDANDGVHELALYERPALDLEAQPHEKRRHRVKVRDGDTDMVKTSYMRHEVHPPHLLVSCASPVEALTGERSRPAVLDMESRIQLPIVANGDGGFRRSSQQQ